MTPLNVQESLLGKLHIHLLISMSSPNLHTNSDISAIVLHTNPYIMLG